MLEKYFPSAVTAEVQKVERLVFENQSGLQRSVCNDKDRRWRLPNGEEMEVPYRIYCDELDLDGLADNEITVAHCLFSRHCNGYIRQKHIGALANGPIPDWAVPYLAEAAGEYVMEILETEYGALKGKDCGNLCAVMRENRRRFYKLYAVMVSYWNLHYRREYPRLKEYIGRKLFCECFGVTRSMEKRVCQRLAR